MIFDIVFYAAAKISHSILRKSGFELEKKSRFSKKIQVKQEKNLHRRKVVGAFQINEHKCFCAYSKLIKRFSDVNYVFKRTFLSIQTIN